MRVIALALLLLSSQLVFSGTLHIESGIKKNTLIENQLFEFANFLEANISFLYVNQGCEVKTSEILKKCIKVKIMVEKCTSYKVPHVYNMFVCYVLLQISVLLLSR